MIQQKGIGSPFRIGCSQFLPEPLLCLLRDSQPVGRWRQLIIKSRQDLPLGRHFRVHPAHTVDDPALSIQQHEIGPAAHSLQHQCAAAWLAKIIDDIQLDFYQTLQRGLGDGGDLSSHQVLAKQHTEHRGLGRVVPLQTGELQPGRSRSGV